MPRTDPSAWTARPVSPGSRTPATDEVRNIGLREGISIIQKVPQSSLRRYPMTFGIGFSTISLSSHEESSNPGSIHPPKDFSRSVSSLVIEKTPNLFGGSVSSASPRILLLGSRTAFHPVGVERSKSPSLHEK